MAAAARRRTGTRVRCAPLLRSPRKKARKMCDVSIAWAGPVQMIKNVNGRAKQLPVNM